MLQIQFDSNDTFGSVCLKEKQNNFMIPFILISEELRAYGGETELNFKHMNRKKLLMAFAVIICLGLSGYGYYRYDRDKRDEAFKQAEESLILSFKENDEFLKEFDEHFVKADKNKIYLEYGKDTIDTVRFIKDKSGESFSIEPETIDLQ